MKTNLPRHHHDMVEQMLDATYDAEDEHALLQQLKTVATYLEQVIYVERAIKLARGVEVRS